MTTEQQDLAQRLVARARSGGRRRLVGRRLAAFAALAGSTLVAAIVVATPASARDTPCRVDAQIRGGNSVVQGFGGIECGAVSGVGARTVRVELQKQIPSGWQSLDITRSDRPVRAYGSDFNNAAATCQCEPGKARRYKVIVDVTDSKGNATHKESASTYRCKR